MHLDGGIHLPKSSQAKKYSIRKAINQTPRNVMNTRQYHSSWWGRIYLMLRADIISNQTTLLTLFGGLLALLFIVPRVGILFKWDYSDWLDSWRNTYNHSFIKGIIDVVTFVYFFVYLNKRVVHSSPTLFSTIPANFWEKVASIALYWVFLSIASLATSYANLAMEYIATLGEINWSMATDTLIALPISLSESLTNTPDISQVQRLLILSIILGGILQTYSVFTFTSIRIKRVFLSLVVGFLIMSATYIVAATIGVNIVISITRDYTPSEEVINQWADRGLIITNVYVWAVTIYFAVLSYKRLRTVSS